MFFGLVDDGIFEKLRQFRICCSLTERGFNVHFLVGKKAVTQLTVGSETYSVARGAKVVAHWTYDAYHAWRIGPAEMASRTISVFGDNRFQCFHSSELL